MTHRLRFIVSILLAVVAAQFLHAQEVKQQLPSSIDSISTIVPEPSLIQSEEGVPSLAQANPEDSTQERIDMGYFSPFGRIGVGLYPTPWGIWSPLHEGLNVSLGMSVFAQLGKKALYKGAGFQQGVSMMYVEPVTSRLSVALGGYMNNVTWAHNTLRDAGISAIMGYQFDEHWEAYLYGQKSLVNNANYPMQGRHRRPHRGRCEIQHHPLVQYQCEV